MLWKAKKSMSFYNLKSQSQKKKKNKPQQIFAVETFFRTYINALKAKALFFTYSCVASQLLYDFLTCLETNSRIAAYQICSKDCSKEQNIKIFLNYESNHNKPVIPKIIYYSGQGRTRSATVKMLRYFHRRNPNSFTLIKTAFGITDLRTCLSRNWGGVVLISLI